jgi:hypothetical protein
VERRRHPRINDTLLLELENGYGMVLDMSIQGMRITPDQLPNEQEVNLRLKINGQAIIMKGEICWRTEPTPDGSHPEIGIRLTEIPEAYRQYIGSLMASPEDLDEEHRLDQIFENRCSVTINPDALSERVFDLELPERQLPVRSLKSFNEDGNLADIFAS